jgi:hypothetical protein
VRLLTTRSSVADAIFPSSPPRRTRSSALQSLGKILRHPYSDLPDDSWKRHVSAIQVSAKLSIRVAQPMPPRGNCDDRYLKTAAAGESSGVQYFQQPGRE